MKIMISQPMKGLTKEQIEENRAEVVAGLTAKGHEIVDSFIPAVPPETSNEALWCLGASLQTMAGVDAVYFMDGWKDARGCRLECEACMEYGIQHMDMWGV